MAPLLASADSNIIKLWNCGYNKENAKGSLLFQLRNTFSPFDTSLNISCIEWSQDSTKLVIGTFEGEIILIDFENSTTQKILVKNEKIYSVRFFQKSKYLLISGNKKIIRWDIKDKKFLNSLAGNKNSAIILISTNPEETQIAAVSIDGSVILFNFESGTKKILKNNSKQAINCIEFSRQKTHYLAMAGDDGNIYVYSVRQSNKPSTILENVHYAPIQSIQFDPRDKNRIFSVGLDKRIVVSSIEENRALISFETSNPLYHVTTNPEGNVLACSTDTGEILFYDLRFKRLVGTIPAYDNQPIKGLLFQYTKVSPVIMKQMSKVPLNAESNDIPDIVPDVTTPIKNDNTKNENNPSVMSMFSPLKNEEENQDNNRLSSVANLKTNIENATKSISNELKFSLPNHNSNSVYKKPTISSNSLNRFKSNDNTDLGQNQGQGISPTLTSPSLAGNTNLGSHSRKGSNSSISSFLSNADSINKQYQRQMRIEQLKKQLKQSSSNSNMNVNNNNLNDSNNNLRDKLSNDSISLSSSLNSSKSSNHPNLTDQQGLEKSQTPPQSASKLLPLERRESFANIKPHTSNISDLMSSLKRSHSLADKKKSKSSFLMSPSLSYSSNQSSANNSHKNLSNSLGPRNLSYPSFKSTPSDSEFSPSLSSSIINTNTNSQYSSQSRLAISSNEDLASNNFSNSSLPSNLKQSYKPTSHSSSNTSLPSSLSYSTYGSSNSNSNDFAKSAQTLSKIHSLNNQISSTYSINSPLARASAIIEMDLDKTMNTDVKDKKVEPLSNLNNYNPIYQSNQNNGDLLNNPFNPANLNLFQENHQPKEDIYSESSYNPTIRGDHHERSGNLFPNSLAYEKSNHYRSHSYPISGLPSLNIEGDSMISDTSTITSTMVKKNNPASQAQPQAQPQAQAQAQAQAPPPQTNLPSSSSTLQTAMNLPLPRINSINEFIHHQELRHRPNQHQLSGGSSHDPTSPHSINTPGLDGDYISIEDVQALANHSIPHKMLLTALENSVEKIRDDFQEDITNMHLEIIRQFHIQKIDFEKMFNQYSVISNIQKEIDYLREENLRLKNMKNNKK